MVDTVVTTVEDEFGLKLRKYYKRREFLVLAVCAITFLMSLPTLCRVKTIFYFIIEKQKQIDFMFLIGWYLLFYNT